MNRHMHGIVLLGVLALGLAGCGKPPPREPRGAEETVFGDQVRALDRARAVEEEAEARKRELDRRIDQDSGEH